MKNPFEKKTNDVLYVSLIVGALTAAGVAYLFLTEDGEDMRQSIGHKIKEGLKELASGVISDKTNIPKKTVKAIADHVVK